MKLYDKSIILFLIIDRYHVPINKKSTNKSEYI